MEYGDAITRDSFEKAVELTRRLRTERDDPLPVLAELAVANTYCVCVTEGEDAAEHRFSDVHRKLIGDVIERVRTHEADGSA